MIRIGLGPRQKQNVVKNYLKQHNIKKVFCFYFKRFPLALKVGCDIEHIEYADIEMYKYFYRLLEEINGDSLVIINECMRTQNRSELIYNCAHHYLNQTPHRIIFEYFPIIDTRDDFMILLDFLNKDKYRGKSFDYLYLKEEDIRVRPRRIKLTTIGVDVTARERQQYEKKKDHLFANLGQKDPDTIFRNLQIFAGGVKKKDLKEDTVYVARNKRFRMKNVFSYNDIEGKGDYHVIDTHYRRLNLNDFLKVTGMMSIKYLCTTLPALYPTTFR